MPEPTALKALAHPVRLRVLGMLRIDGPATATQLAARLNLNSGATSYHLRQLAQYGFIEEAPHASRRDRWWRASHEITSVPPSEAEGEGLELDLAFNQAALSLQVSQMQQALEKYADLPAEWRKATAKGQEVALLADASLRRPLRQAVARSLPDLAVVAYQEVPGDLLLEPAALIKPEDVA